MPLPSRSSRSSVAPIAIGDLPELPLNITDRAMMVRWYADFRQVLQRLLETAANSAPSSLTNGLMAQAAYDADADGVVDRAKAVDYSGVTGKPATYPAASHQHPPSDVAGLPAIYEAVENLEAQVGEGVAGDASTIGAATVDFGVEQSWAEASLELPAITMNDRISVWIEGDEEAAVLQISCGVLQKIEGVGLILWAFAPNRASGVFTLSYQIN